MAKLHYEIRPIRMDEWLPDRCMGPSEALDPKTLEPHKGCESLSTHCEKLAPGSREQLEALYRDVLERFGCCGFVAWVGDRVVGYSNFFPREVARDIRFYGWGAEEDTEPSTLVHNCVSILSNPKYLRRGIGTDLVLHSLRWGKANGWRRFEVHNVFPDHPRHWQGEQKSCPTFWRKLGLEAFRQHVDFGLVQRYGRWDGVTIETEDQADEFMPDWREQCIVRAMAADLATWQDAGM